MDILPLLLSCTKNTKDPPNILNYVYWVYYDRPRIIYELHDRNNHNTKNSIIQNGFRISNDPTLLFFSHSPFFFGLDIHRYK